MRVNASNINPSLNINYFLTGSEFPGEVVNYSLDASDSPVLVNLTSQQIEGSAESLGRVILSFWQSPTTLSPTSETDVVFNLFGSTYTTSSNPSKGEFFSWGTDINSRNLSAQSLADQINSDLNINWKYTAIVANNNNGAYVRLVAKYTGSFYDPFLDFHLIIDGVEVDKTLHTLAYQSGSDNTIGQQLQQYGYSFYLELWQNPDVKWGRPPAPDNSNDKLLATLEASWNNSNNVVFDISRYLRSLVEIPVPFYNSVVAAFVAVPEATSGYYYKWGEKFNGGYATHGLNLPDYIENGLNITFEPGNYYKVESGTFQIYDPVAAEFTPYTVQTDFYFPISEGSLPYYITVYVDYDGIVDYIFGTQAAQPAFTANPPNTFLLGYIYVPAGDLTGLNLPYLVYPYGPIDIYPDIVNTYSRKYEIGKSNIRWVARGAFSENYNPNVFVQYWQTVQKDGTDNHYSTVRFCTDQPLYKMRRRQVGSEYLYFYNLNDHQLGATRKIRVVTIHNLIDGTQLPPYYSHLQNTVSHSGLFYIDVNSQYTGFFQASNINAVDYTETYLQMELTPGVWDRITESQYYEYDQNSEKIYSPVVWRNSFGCFDSFLFEGFQSQSIEVQQLLYTQTIENTTGWLPTQKYKGVFNANPTIKLTLNSGWVNAEHYQWFQNLISSTDVLIESEYVVLLLAGAPIFYINQIKSKALLQTNITNYNWQMDNLNSLFNLEMTLEVSLPKNSITD